MKRPELVTVEIEKTVEQKKRERGGSIACWRAGIISDAEMYALLRQRAKMIKDEDVIEIFAPLDVPETD